MEEIEPGLGWEFVERVAQHSSRMSGCRCRTRLLIPSPRLSCSPLATLPEQQSSNLVFHSRAREAKQASQNWRFRTRFSNISCQDFTRHVHSGVAVVMASSVVKRIPLIRFPARMKTPVTPAATGSPASASSALGAESKTPPTTGVDAAGSSRPLHSNVPSQKPPAGGAA